MKCRLDRCRLLSRHSKDIRKRQQWQKRRVVIIRASVETPSNARLVQDYASTMWGKQYFLSVSQHLSFRIIYEPDFYEIESVLNWIYIHIVSSWRWPMEVKSTSVTLTNIWSACSSSTKLLCVICIGYSVSISSGTILPFIIIRPFRFRVFCRTIFDPQGIVWMSKTRRNPFEWSEYPLQYLTLGTRVQICIMISVSSMKETEVMSGDEGRCRPIYTERQQSFQSSRATLTVLLGKPSSGCEAV